MPLIDITNPDVIKFLIENYDKTTRLRMKWNQLNKDKLQQAATLQRAEIGATELGIIRDCMAAGMPTIERDHVVARMNRRSKAIRDGTYIPGIAALRKGHSIPEVGLGDPKEDPRLARGDNDLNLDPKMRPIDPKQKEILFKEIPVYGREVYLKSRNKMSPESKYYFMESGGWEYGWRLRDSFFSRNATQFGRVWRLTKGDKSRTGPQPDPYYYRSSDIPGPSKCF